MKRLRQWVRFIALAAVFGASGGAAAFGWPGSVAWQCLVPDGRIGAWSIRVSHARFDIPPDEIARRLASAWAGSPIRRVGSRNGAVAIVSRLIGGDVEMVELRALPGGRSDAIKSRLTRIRRLSDPATRSGSSRHANVSFESVDGATRVATYVRIERGSVGTAIARMRELARHRGMRMLHRFDAPADAPERLRGAVMLAFAGAGGVAVVTAIPHTEGAAVVAHWREARP